MGRSEPAQDHMILDVPSVTFAVSAQEDIGRQAQGRKDEEMRLVTAAMLGVSPHSTCECTARRSFYGRWRVAAQGLWIDYDVLDRNRIIIVGVRTALLEAHHEASDGHGRRP